MSNYKLVLTPIEQGLLISLGTIILGNFIKPIQRDVGNMVQGIGIGGGVGTIAHKLDECCSTPRLKALMPHHDITGLAIIPVAFILDKINAIPNKDITDNLYGIGIGLLSEHLLAEGCSMCDKVYYCRNGENLC